jgi:hypothetical protein
MRYRIEKRPGGYRIMQGEQTYGQVYISSAEAVAAFRRFAKVLAAHGSHVLLAKRTDR